MNIAKAKALFASMKDAFGDPLVPEVDQPEELPLLNPKLYSGIAINNVRLRDRQFDSPDDVEDSEKYTAHINLSEELKDFGESDKDLPGQKTESDITTPADEPIPATAFALKKGTVSCTFGESSIIGNGTKFTEELKALQTILIKNTKHIIHAIPDDTTLILKDTWTLPSASGLILYVYMLRPFGEFFDTYNYSLTTKLGSSNLVLRDMLANYIPPTIEKPTNGFTVPAAPTTPNTQLGNGIVEVQPRTAYNEKTSQEI